MQTDAALRRDLVPALLRASDQRLVEQVRAGSERAFEALFDRHYRSVLAFCREMLGSQEEAEDALQLTFLAAYRDLMDSERPIVLRPWLHGIARHRCLSALRLRRERPVGRVPDAGTDQLGAALATREDLRAILVDVAGLPESQRVALVLAELGGVSHAEIGQILGCRREKVKALVFQARASLTAARTARETPCAEIREQLATLRGGALRRAALRHHLRGCPGCRAFSEDLRSQRRRLLLPLFPTVGLKRTVLRAVFGSGSGGVGETALSAGAMSAGGLATAALAALVIHAGGIVVAVTPARDSGEVARIVGPSTGTTPAASDGAMLAAATPLLARSEHARPQRYQRPVGASVPTREPIPAPQRPTSPAPTGNAGDVAAPESPVGGDGTGDADEAAVADGAGQAAPAEPPAAAAPAQPPRANAPIAATKPATPSMPPESNQGAEPPAAAGPSRPLRANAPGNTENAAGQPARPEPPDMAQPSPRPRQNPQLTPPEANRHDAPSHSPGVAKPTQPPGANAQTKPPEASRHDTPPKPNGCGEPPHAPTQAAPGPNATTSGSRAIGGAPGPSDSGNSAASDPTARADQGGSPQAARGPLAGAGAGAPESTSY